MRDIYIIGSGGLAKEIAFLLEAVNKIEFQWNIIGYVDTVEKIGTKNGKYSVITTDDDLISAKSEVSVVNGTGFNKISSNVIKRLKQNPLIKFPNIIHPNFIGDIQRIKFGEGNIITANNVFTTDIELGSFNLFNLSCTLGHDSLIGDFNVFNPTVNLSGGIKIGNMNLIGTGVQILQYLELGDEVIVGAGSVVTKNCIESGTYIGIPARKIK